jgi:virginiamycin A acetyltransferase
MTVERPFARPDAAYPVTLPDGSPHPGTVYLRAVIDHPRIEVRDYTYASAHHPPADWAAHLAPFTYPFSPETLVIGRFCQIADGAVFVTSSANHRRDGISTYPFAIFGGGPAEGRPSMPEAGPDTIIGHDVWIGTRATILPGPGARIGSGCIIGAGAVVGGEIPPYSVVAGNPGRVIRRRFDATTIARLLDLAWWFWPIDRILQAEAAICGDDVDALDRLRP